MKKILLTLLCLLLGLSGAHAATLNKVAAVVNGQMISYFDVQQAALPELKKSKINVNSAANKEKVEQIYKQTLDNMILELLILDEAQRHTITASDLEVDTEITRIMQQSRMSKEAFEKQLQSEGLNPDALRSRIHSTIIRQKLMTMMVGRKVVVRPEDVRDYYDAHKNELKNSKQMQLALLVYPDTSNAAQHAAAIKKDSSKFEQIAKEISIGPNKENGGFLGDVPVDKLDPRLAKLIADLKEGEATQVIVLNGKKAQFKLVQAASEGGIMSFEEAKPIVEGILREPKLKERFDEYIGSLRKKAMVDIRM